MIRRFFGVVGAMRILIVDDCEIALEAMRDVLREKGHEVRVASSPFGISSIVLRERIDVVVLDVELASVRGDLLVEVIRKQPRMANLGVVLVSARTHQEVEALRAQT